MNKSIYLLYAYDENAKTVKISENSYESSIHKLGLINKWNIVTFGSAYKLSISNGSEIVHTSIFMKHCFKFPFMKKNDIIIGPCVTIQKYRGQGLYPFAIRKISNWYKLMGFNDKVYLLIEESNVPSRRGAEKAGCVVIGRIKKTKILKIYKCV